MTASFIKLKSTFLALRQAFPLALVLIFGFVQLGIAQNPNFKIFKNFFVTGDYVVAGWVQGASDASGYAPGVISIPDNVQAPYLQSGVPASVPKGADIVAAYLYWATVEGSQNTLAGQTAFFNGYKIQELFWEILMLPHHGAQAAVLVPAMAPRPCAFTVLTSVPIFPWTKTRALPPMEL